MVDRSKNRSDRYQSIFAELPYSNEMMAEFAEREGVINRSDPELKERYLDAKERLRISFWRLVDDQLTPRQREVLKLCCDGLTQIEIAVKLNVNQSSITKSINGNCDYRNGKRVYGGAKKKLKRLVEKDIEIQNIFKELSEINSEYDYY